MGLRPTPVMPVTERRPCIHASCGGPSAHHCGPSAQFHQHLKFGFPCHIRGGPFFEFFRSDVCSLRYEVKHASSLHVYGRRARAHARRGAKIVVNIHWTLLSNFPFLHHPPFLHRLKTMTKYRNMHARLHALHAYARMYGSQIFFGASLMPPPTPSCIKIRLRLHEI